MIARLLLPVLFTGCLLADVTLEQINERPPCRAKNFLIWQYLQQDITPQQASEAFYQTKDVNKRFFLAYAKKSDDKAFQDVARCWTMGAREMFREEDDLCAQLSLSPYAAVLLSEEERDALAKRFADTPHAPWLEMLSDANMSKRLESYDPKTFLRVANGSGSKFRRKYLNTLLSEAYMKRLEKAPGFSRFAYLVATEADMEQLQRSLLHVSGEHTNAQTAFFLAMNHLRYHQKHDALLMLDRAYEKAYFRIDKDKALFWKYLISDDITLLDELSESFDLNIYSIYAKELLEKPISNYFTYVKTTEDTPDVDITDPFVWNDILDQIESTPDEELAELARDYRSSSLIGVQSYIMERANGYRTHSYIMPYEELMDGIDTDDKAMIWSLMRQESRFIPSALSHSYALGLMQLMPFLVKHLDKEIALGRETYFDMFEPEFNITYAARHLAWLKYRVWHPLFIAYAYNGGIGFTKRHLEKGTFREGKYEPFLSMEMMGNSECREYGKKVLANYVIYKKVLGEQVSIVALFDRLTEPSQTDRFRK